MIKRKSHLNNVDEWRKCYSDFTYFCKNYVKKPGRTCESCPYSDTCKKSNGVGRSAGSLEFGKMKMEKNVRVYNPYTDAVGNSLF